MQQHKIEFVVKRVTSKGLTFVTSSLVKGTAIDWIKEKGDPKTKYKLFQVETIIQELSL